MSNTGTTLRVMKQVSAQDVDAVDVAKASIAQLQRELATLKSDNRGLRVYIDELESIIRETGTLLQRRRLSKVER